MSQFSGRPGAGHHGSERGIYTELRRQIEDGTLAAGQKLPSTRALAAQLCVSRTTVTAAYEQLAAEGFVQTSSGKAARVMAVAGASSSAAKASSTPPREIAPVLSQYAQRVAAMQPYCMAYAQARIDFRFGAIVSGDFPALTWQRAYRDELIKRQPGGYHSVPEGEMRLRTALQGYLRRARGLTCDPQQILVIHGSQQGLDLCARLLLNPGDAFVFEDPGYRMARQCFEATGARPLPIAVDTSGLDTRCLPDSDQVRLAYVTPSHQFPMGAVLPITRRLELLAWASRNRAWIIEDDYGGEFRYGQRPIDALQSTDTDGRVIYVGTFSKALTPQLRLGYLVLPRELVQVFREAKRLTDRHSASWEQNVLASMIESGAYERHVRRLRRENERRRKALLEAVEAHMGGISELRGMAAGLHGVLRLPTLSARQEASLQAASLERGVGVYPLSPLFAKPIAPDCDRPAALILGYAGLTPQQIDEGVRILASVVNEHLARGDQPR